MKVGIIGAGQIGATLTRRLTDLGHEVFVANSRGPDTLSDLAAETGATAVSVPEAVRGVDLRFLLNKQSGLEPNPDGSLTLAFAPRKPAGLPEPNWLPTPDGQSYNLTYRFYGPSQDIVSGEWFPPPLTEQK